QPRALVAGLDEADGLVGAPARLVQGRVDVVAVSAEAAVRSPDEHVLRLHALTRQPGGVVTAVLERLPRVAAVPDERVAVVRPRLVTEVRRGEVELADEPALVASIGPAASHEGGAVRELAVAVAVHAHMAWVAAREEARPARGAHRALAVGPGERGAAGAECVERRRVNRVVAKRMHGVAALLIRADPQDVGALR